MLRKLVSNSTFSLINNLLQLVLSLGSGMLIARFLGVKGKGEVYLITQVYTMLQIVFSIGLGSALLYFLKKEEINRQQSNAFIVVYCLLMTVFFAMLLFTFGSSIGFVFGGEIPYNFLVLSFLLALLNISSSFVGYAGMAEEEGVKWWSICTFLGNIFYLIMLVVFIIFIKLSTVGVIYALLISVLVKLALLAWPVHKDRFKFERINGAQFKKIVLYGFQIFISNLFLTSVFRIDTFFLNKMSTVSQLGIYSVATSVGELLLLIPNAIGVALFPHLSGLKRADQRAAMCVVGRVCFIIGLLGILGLAVIGYPFIIIIFGKAFISAFPPFLMLLPGLFAMTLNYSYSNYFSSIGKPLIGAYAFSIGLFINIILNVVLIPNLGISGAAISSSTSYLAITIGFVVFIKREDNVSIIDFVIPQKSDFIYIIDKVKTIVLKK